MSNTYVVIIGINEYPNLGATARLHGARNDAVCWARFVRERLGVDAEKVQVLASPALSPAEVALSESQLHGATLAEAATAIEDMVRWLDGQPDGAATGLVVFSGHGAEVRGDGTPSTSDFDGDRLAMVMADGAVDGGVLTGALVFSQLDALLRGDRILDDAVRGDRLRRRVTVIVDACYTKIQAAACDRNALGELAPHDGRLGTRLMLGTAMGSTAYEGRIGLEWRGVYSFALTTLLSQWRQATVNGVTVVLGSYRELTFRARELLGMLGYADQAPDLAGAPLAPPLPFNNPSLFEVQVPAVWGPDGARHAKELSGETGDLGIYVFELVSTDTNKSNIFVAQVLWSAQSSPLTVNSTVTVSQNTELWWRKRDLANTPDGTYTKLKVTYSQPQPSNGTLSVSDHGMAMGGAAASSTGTWNLVSSPSAAGTWFGPFPAKSNASAPGGTSSEAWVQVVWQQRTDQKYESKLEILANPVVASQNLTLVFGAAEKSAQTPTAGYVTTIT